MPKLRTTDFFFTALVDVFIAFVLVPRDLAVIAWFVQICVSSVQLNCLLESVDIVLKFWIFFELPLRFAWEVPLFVFFKINVFFYAMAEIAITSKRLTAET